MMSEAFGQDSREVALCTIFRERSRMPMLISVVNYSESLSDDEVQRAVRSVNRQIAEDFRPHWGLSAVLRLEGRTAATVPGVAVAPEIRGDAVLYLADEAVVAEALAYHSRHLNGLPFGFVFTGAARQAWTVTLSHEALDLLADAHATKFSVGPHPDPEQNGRAALYWYEVCDAVQAEIYRIDGVSVSNFVLPSYFTGGTQKGTRNDFLNRPHPDPGGERLRAFGVKRGGYAGFLDLADGRPYFWFAAADDREGRSRLAKAMDGGLTRRTGRRLTVGDIPDLDRHLNEAQEVFEARRKVFAALLTAGDNADDPVLDSARVSFEEALRRYRELTGPGGYDLAAGR